LKNVISITKAEERRRADELQVRAMDIPPEYRANYEYDEWLFVEAPFVHELCLMVLVAVRHEVERELVRIAAQVGEREITVEEYRANLQREQMALLRKDGWQNLRDKLKLESDHTYECMEALRLLANSYKHSPFLEPKKELLKLLNLKTDVKYASLPESDGLREGLGCFIGLGKDAAFSDIAERFVDEAISFIDAVRRSTALSPIKSRPVSLDPKDFLY
jgi:hypothetical protein